MTNYKVLTLNGNSMDILVREYDNWCDILMDNPFGYEHAFRAYTMDGDAFDSDSIIDLMDQLSAANISTGAPLMVNGCKTNGNEMSALCIYVAEEGAIWDPDLEVSDRSVDEDMDDCDNTNDDSFDGSW